MISKIFLNEDNKVISKENTNWVQGSAGNNIHLYIQDPTISLVELTVVKPGGRVSQETVKFLAGFDEEGNTIWTAPDGIPSSMFDFTFYGNSTVSQAMFSFKIHSQTDLLDFKYKLTVDVPFTIEKSGSAYEKSEEDNETDQWRAIGSNSNHLVQTNIELQDHINDTDRTTHGMDVHLDALGLDLTNELKQYTDDEVENLDTDITERLTHKVDKITGISEFDKVYIKDRLGNQSSTDISLDVDGVTLVKRDAQGRAKVSNPVANTDAANKGWVDTKLDNHNTSDDAHANQFNLKADLVNGVVPAHQLPSFVDDVLVFETYASLPRPGESGKLYVVTHDEMTGNDHSTYRWAGTNYILIHDQLSNSEVKQMYEANANTNAFTDALKTKLNDLYTRQALDALINDRYTIAEFESRFNDLLARGILQDTRITHGGLSEWSKGTSIPYTVFTEYNWIKVRVELTSSGKVAYGFFNPMETVDGSSFKLLLEDKTYAQFTRTNGNISFQIVDDTGANKSDEAKVKIWGVKTSGITADLINYKDGTVEDALNNRYTKQEIDDSLLTFNYNDVEGISENNYEYVKTIADDKPARLTVEGRKVYKIASRNADFKNGLTDWSPMGPSWVTVNDGVVSLKKELGADAKDVGIFQDNILGKGKYYFSITHRYNGDDENRSFPNIRNTISGSWSGQTTIGLITNTSTDGFIRWSSVGELNYDNNRVGLFSYVTPERFIDFDLKDFIFFNLTELQNDKVFSPMFNKTFDLLTDEQMKQQMDVWVGMEREYLAGGGWTSFRNIPRSILNVETKDGVSEVDYLDRLYYHINEQGTNSGYHHIDSKKISANEDDSLLVMFKVSENFYDKTNLLVGLFNKKSTTYTNTWDVFPASSSNGGILTAKINLDQDFEDTNWVLLISRSGGFDMIGEEVSISDFTMINLTEIGDDHLSVSQAYDKYKDMMSIISKNKSEGPSHVEVIEGSKNLFDIDSALNDFLVKNEDGSYTITKTIEGRFAKKVDTYIPANTPFTIDMDLIDSNIPEGGVKWLQFAIKLEDGSEETLRARLRSENQYVLKYDKAIVSLRPYIEYSFPDGTFTTFKNLQVELYERTDYVPYLDPITLGTLEFDANPTESQVITYEPRKGGRLEFKDVDENVLSLIKYAKDKLDILGTALQYTNEDITDNWASIISKTNSSIVKIDDHEDRLTSVEEIIHDDSYNTTVGVVNAKTDYHKLTGITEDSFVRIAAKGQNIRNMMPAQVIENTNFHGVSITYDETTGEVTLDGTYTGPVQNYVLAQNIDLDINPGDWSVFLRYYNGGTVDLNGGYIGYVFQGSKVSHRINENSESLYDPYISQTGPLEPADSSWGQRVLIQFWKTGMVFNNFKIRLGFFEGTALQGYILPSETGIASEVEVVNRTVNVLPSNAVTFGVETGNFTASYDKTTQEFTLNGEVDQNINLGDILFSMNNVERISLSKFYVSGEANLGATSLDIRVETDEVSFTKSITNSTAKENTIISAATPLRDVIWVGVFLEAKAGQVFDNYKFKLMITESAQITPEFVPYERETVGYLYANGREETRPSIEFKAKPYGVVELIPIGNQMNMRFGVSIVDIKNTVIDYNSSVFSSQEETAELIERVTNLDSPFRGKLIAVWGDSRESNNPTSDPNAVGDQLDTSWPNLLAQKLGTQVLNFGLSGGAWAENTVQQDAGAAIVNRISTQDPHGSADIIIISSMNDFKLATPLGSPDPTNKDKTTYYGALRTTFDIIGQKYPGKQVLVVLPQKRYDEDVNYGGGSYHAYRKAQEVVCDEYSIPTVDLYRNIPGKKGTAFYNTNMLNDTHWTAQGNALVAETVARKLIGNGASGYVDTLPIAPQTDGSYVLRVVVTNGIPEFKWVLE